MQNVILRILYFARIFSDAVSRHVHNLTDRFSKCYIIQFTICVICNNKHEWKCSSEKCSVAPLNYGENNFMVNNTRNGNCCKDKTQRMFALRKRNGLQNDVLRLFCHSCKTEILSPPPRRNVASSVLRRSANFSLSPRDPVIQRSFRIFITKSFFLPGEPRWKSFESIYGEYLKRRKKFCKDTGCLTEGWGVSIKDTEQGVPLLPHYFLNDHFFSSFVNLSWNENDATFIVSK